MNNLGAERMTQQTVAIHFTYVVGGETKEGSTEVRARVEDVESKEEQGRDEDAGREV